MYDLVIRNGTIVDGSGLAPYRGDIGIRGDRIAHIGRIREPGRREIDAEGMHVTPGFIDGHTHMDAQIMWDPAGTSSCWHGVTTVVMGNCGFTLAPSHSDHRELVVRNLEKAEDMSPAVLAAGIDWSFETFPEYLDLVERLPKGLNYAANIGHSALRTWAMGERAFSEQANDDDLKLMADHLRLSLDAGAIGFTTSRSDHHQTSDGRLVASCLADWKEIRHLVGVMADAGHGIFEITPGPGAVDDPDDWLECRTNLGDLALETGVPVTWGMGTVPVPQCYQTLDLLDSVVDRGGRMFLQTHSRGVGLLYSFVNRLPYDRLPAWGALRALPLAEQAEILRDPVRRRPLVEAAMELNELGAGMRLDYDVIRVIDSPVPPNPTLAEVAAARGIHPVEAVIELALETDMKQFFWLPVGHLDDNDLEAVLKHPRTIMTFSDSGAHVGQICDASIQTHLLAYWVRVKQAFTLPEAVRMLTLAPAIAWGFADRGLLRPGMVADVNVFDAATVGPLMPEVVEDLPSGGRRIEQRATGFRATVVGGQITVLDGRHTGVFPGRLLRAGLDR